MRSKAIKQVRVISGSTPVEFQNNLNDVLKEMAEKKYTYEMQFNNNMGLCAYVVYEQVEDVAETHTDAHMLSGDIYICAECPYFKMPTDGRVKRTFCEHCNSSTCKDSSCCEKFYEELDAGKIKPLV